MSEGDGDSEEEDLPVLGGEGFTPEELAQAEQQFSAQLVSAIMHEARVHHIQSLHAGLFDATPFHTTQNGTQNTTSNLGSATLSVCAESGCLIVQCNMLASLFVSVGI